MESLIDLKALLVERPDCDAGTVRKLRDGLAQNPSQLRVLREVADILRKKIDAAQPAQLKPLHLKLGIVSYFLGQPSIAIECLQNAEGATAAFYLGRALLSLGRLDQAHEAFERAEKTGYNANTIALQKAGIRRRKGELSAARELLKTLEKSSIHDAEYHYQLACVLRDEGEKLAAVRSWEESIKLDPTHTGSLFELGYANDLAGNDDDAIGYYERCLRYPPLHKGAINNLGVLYEDNEKYDKAIECYNRLIKADWNDERAKLFLKDAQAAMTAHVPSDDEGDSVAFRQVMEIPITDFELSVRSRNCLKKMNIRTLGDLTRVSEQQLLASKNFGETSLDELKQIMGTKGLRIGQSLEQGAQFEIRYRPQQQLTAEEQAILGKSVGDLNLSVRARKCMNRLGINTLAELVQRTADELLEAKNFGMTSLTEVRDKLNQYGLKLRGD